MKKYKKIIITVVCIIVVLGVVRTGVYLWNAFNVPGTVFGYVPDISILGEQGTAFAHAKVNGCRREQLIAAWGNPMDTPNPSEDMDMWKIDDATYLQVYYNGLDKAVVVRLVREE